MNKNPSALYQQYFILVFSFLVSINFVAAQNSTSFKDYVKKGHANYDSRQIDSSNFYLKKLDSLVLQSPKDSSKYYEREVLKSSLLLNENKKGEAVEVLLKSLTFFKQQKDSANIGFSLYRLGVANYYINRRLIAGDYFKEALFYSKYIPKRLETRIYQNFGTINLEEGMSETKRDTTLIYKAVKSYRKAIQIFHHENWVMEEALATSLLAECYNQLKNYNTALTIIDQAILLSKKAKNKSQEGFALIKKTAILGNKKRYLEALETIQIAKPIFEELKDHSTFLYALGEEKKILKGLGRFKEAASVGDLIYATSVKSYNTRFADKVSEMDAKYKTAENEKKLAIQKQELLDKELKIQKKNLYIIIVSSTLLILLILSSGIYKKQRFKREQLQKELNLKDALTKIKTQNKLQKQRLEISRDLHDNIGSQLTFIISSIDNLKYISKDLNEQLKTKLSNISSFTFDTIHQLRDTIWAMNKNDISFDEFHTRIMSYIEKSKVVKPEVQFDIQNTTSSKITFTSVVGMNLFRIVQEAINNAIKHSEATKVSIDFSEKESHILIKIEDNGKGFDKENFVAGNGLSNIENRISEIKGKVLIHSEIDQGTCITLKLNR